MASTTLESVAGRPSRTLSSPREFLLPAGAAGSIFVEWEPDAAILLAASPILPGVLSCVAAIERASLNMPAR